jgi:hypothetical protein
MPVKRLPKRKIKKIIKQPAQAELALKGKDIAEIFENLTIRRKRKPRQPKAAGDIGIAPKVSGPSFTTRVPGYTPSFVLPQDLGGASIQMRNALSPPSVDDIARGFVQAFQRSSGEASAATIQPYEQGRLTVEEIIDTIRPESETTTENLPKSEVADLVNEKVTEPKVEFIVPTLNQAVARIRELKNNEEALMKYLGTFVVRHKSPNREEKLRIKPDLMTIADAFGYKAWKYRTFKEFSDHIKANL